MEKDGDLWDRLNKSNGLITLLASLDETFKDEDKVIMSLASLPKKNNTNIVPCREDNVNAIRDHCCFARV